jgi:hypothetical protein
MCGGGLRAGLVEGASCRRNVGASWASWRRSRDLAVEEAAAMATRAARWSDLGSVPAMALVGGGDPVGCGSGGGW